MTFFGDNLNIINVSGIVVVFLGVFLYKATLLLSSSSEHKEDSMGDIENNSQFSRISSSENGEFAYEDEMSTRRAKARNSDPDLALRFKIEDEDSDDDEGDGVMGGINESSSLRERINGSPFEVITSEEENLGVI